MEEHAQVDILFDFYIFQVHLPNDWVEIEIVSVNLVGNIVLITNYNFYQI